MHFRLCEALDANKKAEGALKVEFTKQALTQARLEQLETELAQVEKEKESRGSEYVLRLSSFIARLDDNPSRLFKKDFVMRTLVCPSSRIVSMRRASLCGWRRRIAEIYRYLHLLIVERNRFSRHGSFTSGTPCHVRRFFRRMSLSFI